MGKLCVSKLLSLENTSTKALRGSPPVVEEEEEIEEIIEELEKSLWWQKEQESIEERIEANENDF